MAVDEALLDSFSEQGDCCWRFYRWREPTLSLGYFQRFEDRRFHRPSLHCPVVRRASGGGAIIHDDELTYSLVVAAESRLARQRGRLYEAVHAALIDALAELGVGGASLFGRAGGFSPEREPFLCFLRRSPGDVVYGEAKIAGSAQRRRRGAVLQHGSVLLGRSAAAPELPGVRELARRDVTCDALTAAWLPCLQKHLGLSFSDQTLTDAQQGRARQYVEAKYGADDWTKDRNTRPL
jgi:lipoate-protein ligase A